MLIFLCLILCKFIWMHLGLNISLSLYCNSMNAIDIEWIDIAKMYEKLFIIKKNIKIYLLRIYLNTPQTIYTFAAFIGIPLQPISQLFAAFWTKLMQQIYHSFAAYYVQNLRSKSIILLLHILYAANMRILIWCPCICGGCKYAANELF